MTEILPRLAEHGFERVVFCHDPAAGLRAIIAIHSTTLGPALGGVRMLPYGTEHDALYDVLRLARGMTYKAAISGVDLGGGKSVIIGDPRRDKTEGLLQAMGRQIEALGGGYIAGQDIGTGADDMALIARATRHVTCVAESAGGAGDPSFATAWGVVAGIRAVLEAATGSGSLEDRTVAIQGLGHVGYHVARYCHAAGARLVAADPSAEATGRVRDEFGAAVVAPEAVYDAACDVFAPCAMGAVVNDATVPRFRCLGIAGGANNVLAEPRHGEALAARGILYGPDYLVNAGGLIHCQAELRGERDTSAILDRVSGIQQRTLEVFRKARADGVTPGVAADRLAEERLAAGRAS